MVEVECNYLFTQVVQFWSLGGKFNEQQKWLYEKKTFCQIVYAQNFICTD